MNTISKCLFGGALLGAGLSSPAIGGDVVWGSGSSYVYTYSGSNSSGSGNWNLNIGIGSYGSSASSVGTALGLSILIDGGTGYGSGYAYVDHSFTVTHDMLISFEWDFTGAGSASMQITDSLNTSIFDQTDPSFSSVPLELSFMAGETYSISGYLYTFSGLSSFTMTGGNDISVVPLPPAAFGGLAMLAGLGAYRRVRR